MKLKFVLPAALILAFDHLSKYWISSSLSLGESIEIIRGYLRISYVLNYGVAFGLFAEPQSAWKPYFLAAMAVIAVAVIIVYSRQTPSDRRLLQTALAVTTGGILGNFVDRLIHGSVVDFIEVHIQDRFYWPTFNIADSAITIGIALLLIDSLRSPDAEAGPQKPVSCQDATPEGNPG
jgi:signal peptidase II